MRFFGDEKGVSEIVGVMLILLIGVVYLGVVQSYQVPEWNKEIERQHFDIAYSDFIELRSDFEDVAFRDMPKTGSLHMGTKYPDRFMLQNPGPGAYGTLFTYPLNINISFKNDTGNIAWRNYTSMGIEYELHSLSDFPKLVYENGLIIEDYGGYNFSINERQMLVTGDNIFIPIIGGRVGSISSMSVETFSMFPIGNKNYEHQIFLSANVTIETRYPGIWSDISKNIDIPAGSQFEVAGNTIRITNIPGFSVKSLKRPTPLNLPDITSKSNELYSGVVMISEDENTIITGPDESGGDGYKLSDKDKIYDIPPSDNFTHFIVRNVTLEVGTEGSKTLEFQVRDSFEHKWVMALQFYWALDGSCSLGSGRTNLCLDITQKDPTIIIKNRLNINATKSIDLSSYYLNASIQQPNALEVEKMNDDILYVIFDIV